MIRILSFLYRPSVKNNLPFSIDPDEIIYHISEIGRSFTKCRDIACHFRTITVKKLERFEHKIVWTWNMKYLLPNSFSGPKFFIHQLPENLKMSKFYRDEIEPTNPGRKFSEFLRTFMKLSGFKVQLAPNA